MNPIGKIMLAYEGASASASVLRDAGHEQLQI